MNKLLNNIQGWVHNGYAGNHLQMADYGGSANATTFSGRQFAVYIAEDDTVGTFNTSSNGSEFQRLDVEGITLPTFTPNQEFEMRSGSGRVAEFGAMFSSSKGVDTEFTISGRLDLGSLPILAESVLAQTSGTDNEITLAAGGYEPANISHGADVTANDWHLSLSVYFQSPAGSSNSDSYKLAGCVCTSLTLSADMGTASGRYDYSATFKTRYKPVKGTASMSSATAINATNVFLSEQSHKSLEIFDVDADLTVGSGGGSGSSTTVTCASTANVKPGMSVTGTNIGTNAYVVSITDGTTFVASVANSGTVSGNLTFVSDYTSINPLFNSISLTFESPTVFLGAQGDNAEPEVIARAVPELNMTMAGSVKYDSETDKLLEAHRDPAQTSYIQFYIGDYVPTNLPAVGAVFPQNITLGQNAGATLQWIFHKAKLISASVGSDDVASIDFEAKILDPAAATYEILHLGVGATA